MSPATTTDVRTDVLEAASRIARETDAEAISIKSLTEASGVSNGSIYHHFGSRDGVIAALVLDVFAGYQSGVVELLDGNADDAEAGIRALVVHHLEWVEANPDEARLLMARRDKVAAGPYGRQLADQNREFLGSVSAWLGRQVSQGQMPDFGIDLVHALVFAPAQEVSALWLGGRIKQRPTTFAERLAPAAWAALSSAGGDR